MKIGVMGAGAIGCYLGGRLRASGAEVVLVGRPALAAELAQHGMQLTDYRGAALRVPPERLVCAPSPEVLAGCDVVLVTVKSGDTAATAAQLAAVLAPGTPVVSFQNGVGNPALLRAAGLRVLAGMVPFNVLRSDGGRFHQGTSGTLVIERDGAPEALLAALRQAGLPVRARADVAAVQWGKLLINLNNPVNALSGVPIRAMLGDRGYRRVMAACAREAVNTLRAARVPARLDPPLPPRLVPLLLGLPNPLFRLLARPMVRVDPLARSSMWDDLARGRKTEIDALNGEIVRLAERCGRDAPINRAIVALIREAEAAGRPPGLASATLRARLGI
jgi:2-dehydropantoate 2-reductase